MSIHAHRAAALAALAATTTLLWQPVAAHACGGCFSPVIPVPGSVVQPSQVVLQNAERVFFSRDPETKRSRVWVEVRYSGAAEDFGWVLPLPQTPTVTVGPKLALDVIDSVTSARYILRYRGTENCRNPRAGCEPIQRGYGGGDASVSDSGSGMDAGTTAGGFAPHVTVVKSGQTGPYDYVVVTAKSADPLLAWLNSHGYKTPKKALPILQSHLDKGDVFVAIKLSNGKGVNLIKPIILEMPDAEACVPLRLTSIAAADDMNVVVTIAGPGRAIPKNQLHVRLNPVRIDWFGGAKNVAQVMAAAMDEAGGRAFVTASAQPGAPLVENLFPSFALRTNSYANAVTLFDIARALSQSQASIWLSEESAMLFQKHAKISQHMKITSVTKALSALWTCGYLWRTGRFGGASGACPLTATEAQAIPISGVELAADLDAEIVSPLKRVLASLKASKMVTRLVMRISPDEMDRDPIFAFNPDLPAVSRTRTADYYNVCSAGWTPSDTRRLTYPGLGSWLTSSTYNGIDPRLHDAPAALAIEVLDESGPAMAVAMEQVELVDTAIHGAVIGVPSPAKALTLSKPKTWQPPPSDPLVTTVGVWKRPNNCLPRHGWVDGALTPPHLVPQPSNPNIGVDTNGLGTSNGGTNPNSVLPPTPSAPTATSAGGCTVATTSTGGPAGLLFLLGAVAMLWLRRRVFVGG